jgi:RNA polymerase-binding transcription factor DksA
MILTNKYLNILDNLSDALGRSEGMSIDEIKRELEEEGIEVDVIVSRLKDFQQKISKRARELDNINFTDYGWCPICGDPWSICELYNQCNEDEP